MSKSSHEPVTNSAKKSASGIEVDRCPNNNTALSSTVNLTRSKPAAAVSVHALYASTATNNDNNKFSSTTSTNSRRSANINSTSITSRCSTNDMPINDTRTRNNKRTRNNNVNRNRVARFNIGSGSGSERRVGSINSGHRVVFPALQESIDHLHLCRINDATMKRRVNTSDQYKSHYKGLWAFLNLIGEYESMIILLDEAPLNAPPVTPKNLVLYMKYMRQSVTSHLKHSNGVYVIDVEGEKVLCVSKWVDPGCENQFKTALSTLHNIRGHGSHEYREECHDCVRLKESDHMSFKGCVTHLNEPGFARRSGNPAFAVMVKEYIRDVKGITSGYIPRQMDAIDPFQLHQLFISILSQNSVFMLMIFTLISLAVGLFLRIEEIIKLKFQNINVRMSITRADGTLEALCVQVDGKADEGTQYLYIYKNPKNQVLCGVNAFLWWISISNITKGYLFPTKPSVSKLLSGDSISNGRHVGYNTMLDIIKQLFASVQPSFEYGTHSLRRTAFLIALWYGANDTDLMNTARAKAETIARYRTDATTRKALAELEHKTIEHLFPGFKSQLICPNRVLADFVGSERDNIIRGWIDRWREENSCGDNVQCISTLANSYQSIEAYSDKLINQLAQVKTTVNIDMTVDVEHDKNGFFALLHRVTDTRNVMRSLGTVAPIDYTPSLSEHIMLTGQQHEQQQQQQHEQHIQENGKLSIDSQVRKEYSARILSRDTSKNQLEETLKIISENDLLKGWKNGNLAGNRFEAKTQTFIHQTIKPAISCVEKHCNNCMLVFQKKHPQKYTIRMLKKFCDGCSNDN